MHPRFFPVGAPGTGAQNCISTNGKIERRIFAEQLIKSGRAEEALRSLFIENTTGITKDLLPGQNFTAEIKLVSG